MSSDPLIGATVGGCRIDSIIGQGGMGIIYKARQISLDRVVALKVLAPHLTNDVNFVGRFQREAKAIARVNHPNILQVYDVGDDQNVNYMIMELIDGQSLAEMQTDRQGAIPWEEATEYVRQAADGLEAAQAGGITHRDIKPENLMVTKKGVIKVSDFGLAKEADTSNTSVDAVMGTPAFMSPEQCDGKKVDGRSDIYSLGGTFYRLVTGRLPFEAETAMSMMYRHKHEALVPPHEIVPALPKGMSAIVVKMMAKKREHRYQTMSEVIEAIKNVKRAEQPLPAPASEPIPVPAMAVPIMQPLLQPVLAPAPVPAKAPVFSAFPPAAALSNETGIMSRNDESGIRPNMQHLPQGGLQAVRGMSGRLPAPEKGFGAADSSARMSLHSGLGMAAPGVGGPDDAYTAVSRGDEMIARGDRLPGLKSYRQALQSRTLDNNTRTRVEQELRKEISTRKQATDNLLKRGMLVEAGREARVLVELDPSDEATRAMLKDLDAKLSMKRAVINDVRTAIAASEFERAIKLWDGIPSELRDESLSKQIEQMRMVLVPSVKLSEQGENLSGQGRLEEAMSTFEDALKINPACEPARMGLKETEQKIARIEYMLKEGFQFSLDQDYPKAVETWKPILSLRPGHAQAIKSIVDAYLAHAQQLRAHGDLEGALEAYKGACDTDTQNRTARRALEELTNLRDKEQALVDRAQDAVAQQHIGQALSYWKEVQRINAPSKRAQQQIALLSKQRSKRWSVILFAAVVLLAAGAAGYKYFLETQGLDELRHLLSDHPLNDDPASLPGQDTQLHEVVERLQSTRFFFKNADLAQLLRQVDLRLDIENAGKLEQQGQLAEAAAKYQELADRNKELAPVLGARGLLCTLKIARIQADKAVADHRWDEASEKWSGIVELLSKHVYSNKELDEARPQAEKAARFAHMVKIGLVEDKAGNAQKALEQYLDARKLLPELGFSDTDCDAYLDGLIKKNGYDPKKFDEALKQGMDALRLLPPDLALARDAFQRAKAVNAKDSSANAFLQFTGDLAFCEEKGMSLFTIDTPMKGNRLWGNHERHGAFCIDRYEWPNRQTQIPKSAVTWLEADALCKNRGKALCTGPQWTSACKGDTLTNPYPYGTAPDNEKCNTARVGAGAPAARVAASGERSACVNAIGLYDMSGNLAEWADPGDTANSDGLLMGGSFLTPANQAGCNDQKSAVKITSAADIGFRCCAPLPANNE